MRKVFIYLHRLRIWFRLKASTGTSCQSGKSSQSHSCRCRASMLLSQCLAISLSPSIKCQKLRADLSRESALELFEQFLAENQLGDGKLSSTSRNRHVEQPERSNTEPSAPETMVLIKQELGACKSNTCFELAGFVLPSWLLVSGSTHDLEYLRSRWLDSQLKAPAGFHLETVGK